MKAEQRVAKLRALMKRESIDAAIIRSTTDLQWLTGFEGVFDEEQAHTALVTQEACAIHTDSRYATAMQTAAGEEKLWRVSVEREGAAGFVAREAAAMGLAAGRFLIDTQTPLRLYRDYVRALPEASFAERSGDVLKLRGVKEPGEVERMVKAQRVAEAAFLETLEKIHVGMTEEEVSLILEFAMRSRGAQELAFANIVASGPNSANPHAIPGKRALQKGDLVVFDFGARVDGYRSDTTRTVSVGGPTEQQKRIYDAVLLANTEVRRALKPGVTGLQMHMLAEKILADAGFEGKMGHGLGHGVGLDIHEEPCLNTRNYEPLPEGCIVTVEPGVYLSGADGVRIEDCGQVNQGGFENFCTLTHDLVVVG